MDEDSWSLGYDDGYQDASVHLNQVISKLKLDYFVELNNLLTKLEKLEREKRNVDWLKANAEHKLTETENERNSLLAENKELMSNLVKAERIINES